jgi:hypothetical protein
MRYLPVPFALLLATSIAVAADPPFPPWGKPAAELPKYVVAPADRLTLFADFEHPQVGGLPVYVVNRTAAPIPVKAQDGDLYLKLEYESAPGSWVRAQSHTYSWCGNSYHTLSLDPGRFVVISGYRPSEGEKAKVRYRLYGQDSVVLSSNVGEGLVVKAELERAANDEMTVRTGDFEFVRKVALGETKLQTNHRREALGRLYTGEFDRREVSKVLDVVAKDPDKALARQASLLLHHLKHGEPMWLHNLKQSLP